MRRVWILLAAAALGVGCASFLAIPNDTPSFCAQPANQGHAYCEDFDVGDASARWTFAEVTGGSTYGVMPSDRSPPNLLDLSAPMVPEGGAALAGFTKEFDDSTFVGLHIEADVRFVTAGDASIAAFGGFLLIVDKNGGGCIGVGISGAPGVAATLGAFIFAQGAGCSALTAGGNGMGPGGRMGNLGAAPSPNTWAHVVVDVSPDPTKNDGSGTFTFNIEGQPGAFQPVPLFAGTLAPGGIPLVGFAAETNGPSGPLEVQYDNITIDLRAN